MVHLAWRLLAAAAVSVSFGVKVLRKRQSRNNRRLSPEDIRATAGVAAEQRQRQHEERQRKRAPRRNAGWTTPGDIAKSQQQPSRQHTTASPSGERSGSQQSSPDANTLGTSAPSGSNTAENPFWFPPQYVPSGGEIQPDLRLHTHEDVWVFDAGLTPHRGRAVLDTGNAGCTLITKRFAHQLGLVDFDGNPTQAYLSRTRVQGVVAGAHEMLRQINIQYEIKGKRVRCRAGLTEARLPIGQSKGNCGI